MARRLTRREWTLLGLVALVGLTALWIRDPEFRFGAGPAEDATAALDLGEAPVIRLAKLEPDPEKYDAGARNLFEYYVPPPPPRPKVERKPPPPRVKPTPPKPTPQAAKAPERRPAAARPPRIEFTYLGFLGPKDDRIAVFDDGEETFIARAGDVVRERFRVVEFQYEKVVMGYTDERFKDQTTDLQQKESNRKRR
jgi:hypothetical protein